MMNNTNNKPKYIKIKEFREKGFLQELNRNFLHPLGLSLEVIIDDEGNETINNIWDYRDDNIGLIFDLENSDEERITKFLKNKENVDAERLKHSDARIKLFGSNIEPIRN